MMTRIQESDNTDEALINNVRVLLTELVELYTDSDIDPRVQQIAAAAKKGVAELEANIRDKGDKNAAPAEEET